MVCLWYAIITSDNLWCLSWLPRSIGIQWNIGNVTMHTWTIYLKNLKEKCTVSILESCPHVRRCLDSSLWLSCVNTSMRAKILYSHCEKSQSLTRTETNQGFWQKEDMNYINIWHTLGKKHQIMCLSCQTWLTVWYQNKQ